MNYTPIKDPLRNDQLKKNTVVVSHINVLGSTVSDDVWITHTISDNEDPMSVYVVQ